MLGSGQAPYENLSKHHNQLPDSRTDPSKRRINRFGLTPEEETCFRIDLFKCHQNRFLTKHYINRSGRNYQEKSWLSTRKANLVRRRKI